jgi:hypothetical protein
MLTVANDVEVSSDAKKKKKKNWGAGCQLFGAGRQGPDIRPDVRIGYRINGFLEKSGRLFSDRFRYPNLSAGSECETASTQRIAPGSRDD